MLCFPFQNSKLRFLFRQDGWSSVLHFERKAPFATKANTWGVKTLGAALTHPNPQLSGRKGRHIIVKGISLKPRL